MNKRELLGVAGTFLGSACVGHVIDQLIKQNVSPTGRISAIALKVGAVILSGMVMTQSDQYVSDKIAEGFAFLDSTKELSNGAQGSDSVSEVQ